MPGPWEKYGAPAPTQQSSGKPWEKYAASPSAPHPEDVPYANGSNPLTMSDLMPEAMAPERPRTAGDYVDTALDAAKSLGRAGAMQLGSLAKGAVALPDALVIKPGAALLDRGAQALGADPKYFSGGENGVGGYIQAGLDAAGVPAPSNAVERFADRAVQGLGGIATGAGLGRALLATESVPAQTVGKALSENLGAQTLAATSGNALGQAANEIGLSPKAELAATLLGATVPAVGGGIYDAIGAGARKALGSANAETSALAQRADDLGIPLKATQVSESKAGKVIDSVTKNTPFSGGRAFEDSQQAAFNRAVSRTIGEDADKITPAVFNQARNRIGSEFNRLSDVATLPLSPDVTQRLKQVISETSSFYGKEAAQRVTGILNRLASQNVAGVVPGRAFQSIDSQLGEAIGAGGEASVPLRKLQEALRDEVQKHLSPEDAQAWATARQQYRDLKTIESLVSESGMTTGDVSWSKLMQKVIANKTGKGAMARGDRGDLGDLAAIGQRFLKDPVGNSGTASRLAVMEALKSAAPTIGIGALAAGSGLSGAGVLSGLSNAALTGLSAVGTSRLTQNVLQNPELVQALLGGQTGLTALRKGIQTSTQPTALSLVGGMTK